MFVRCLLCNILRDVHAHFQPELFPGGVEVLVAAAITKSPPLAENEVVRAFEEQPELGDRALELECCATKMRENAAQATRKRESLFGVPRTDLRRSRPSHCPLRR